VRAAQYPDPMPRALARTLAIVVLAAAGALAATPAAADEAVCENSTMYSEDGTGGFYHLIELEQVPAPIADTGYDCTVSSEPGDDAQGHYFVVYSTFSWDRLVGILEAFDTDGWDLATSQYTIDRGDGAGDVSEDFTTVEALAAEDPPVHFGHRAIDPSGDNITLYYVDGDSRSIDPDFEGPQLELQAFISEVDAAPAAPAAATGPADPSVLSELKTIATAVPSPAQVAVIGVSSVLLMLLVGFPGFLLSRVIASRYDQLFGWTRRFATPKSQPTWALWLGIAASAIVASFIDPRFGLNPMSVRILLTVFGAFVVYNLVGWMLVKAIVRRIEPSANPRVLFRWGSIVVLLIAVMVSRLLDFSPGIVFGVVAGLTFAVALAASKQAVVVLIGSGFALSAGLVAWVAYSALGAAPSNLVTVTLTELFSAIAIEGIATLPLALLPFAALDGGVLSNWKKWVWALSYTLGMAAFLLVLVTAPAGFASIPGDFVRWMLIFVAFALVATAIWWFDDRARKKASTPV
jgi:hypothetical protein